MNPTKEYRGKPFWAWNGKLEKEELLRQIHVMKEMGFGGFFMHSRTGLKTEYLGEEWFDLIRACTEEAEKLEMEPWIYDEDRWPSGCAGGIATKNEKFRRKYLTLYLSKEPFEAENSAALFVGTIEEELFLTDYRRISAEEAPFVVLKEKEYFLTFAWRTMGEQSVFNGTADLDRLNEAATREFIRVTHEKYREKCGEQFLEICGVFTDEPTYGPIFSDFGDPGKEQRWSVPWTFDLFERFEETYGYDLTEKLPELFLIMKDKPVSKIKWEYVELLEKLFIDRFLKPVQEWAHENHMLTTGHFVDENSLTSQTVPVGSMLRCYEYLDHPGIDCLTEHRFTPWTVKVLESAARQNGQKWKLSELYGATGWQMSFQDYKYVGDWQAVLGINARCPHLSWYTMEGEAKRDYPGTFLHQATWFSEYHALETYFARLGYLISLGEAECETMVLHPVESVWTQIHVDWVNTLDAKSSLVKRLEKKFVQLYEWLAETGIDFDYADEGILAERAQAGADSEGAYLQVGKSRYRRIVVSGCLTIRETTCRLLEEFQKRGGELIFIGKAPEYISCEESDRGKLLAKRSRQLSFKKAEILAYFQSFLSEVKISDEYAAKEIYLQKRCCENAKFVLLYNQNRKKALSDVKILVPEDLEIELWDCFSGKRYRLEKKKNEICLSFAPGQEYVLCLVKNADVLVEKEDSFRTVQKTEKLRKVTHYSLDEKNVFVLDIGSLWLENTLLAKEEEVLQMDKILRERLGIEHRSGEMVQPWAAKDPERVLGTIRLSYQFQIEKLPETPVYIALEPMKNENVWINGKREVLKPTDFFWIDRCFKVYEISSEILHEGQNVLEITADYVKTGGLEAVYLLGEFGVFSRKGKMVIGELPKKIRIGDLTKQGFPFYGGKITYYFDLPEHEKKEPLWVLVPEFGGSCLTLQNAGERQIIPWKWRSASWEHCGKELAITVVTFRRNTFGPLHQFPIRQPYTAPDSFQCMDKNRYSVFPIGLLKSPEIRIGKEKEDQSYE